jgi:predicted ArsR family transcriptional regulator
MPARGLRTYYKTLDSLSRINLLHALQTRGALTVDELAQAAGLHPNTAREHLHRLIAVGLVRSEPILRGNRGRPVLRYRASGCDAESAPERPTGHLTERPVARATQQLAALGEHLGRCGFAGAIDPGGHELTLRDCPFSALSEGNPQVCEVHRTLIADALRASSGPVRAGRLRRLVTEHECTLELTREQTTTTSSSDLP